MTKISIIIPVFNTQEYIERCIDSVLSQVEVDLECIVVDDCSTDRSVQIVQQYSDPRLRFIAHERNRGQGAARNSGLEIARGEWILYLDSDDSLPQRTLLKMLQAASPEVDIVQGGFNRISPQREWQTLYTPSHYTSHTQITQSFEKLNWTNVTAKLINIRIATIPFDETVIYEDTLWCVQAYPMLENIVVIDTAVYNHYIRAGSTMQSRSTPRKIESQLFIIAQITSQNPCLGLQQMGTYLALNLIKNLYMGEYSSSYRQTIIQKLGDTGVRRMSINRKSLPRFTWILSLGFRSGSAKYEQTLCRLYGELSK